MRTQLMVLDRDPQVTGMAGRPVRLLWHDRRGRVRSWVPQLFARCTDGSSMLADCPGRLGTGGERALKAAQAVAAACTDIGWNYRRLAPLDEVVAANLTWLAGYRHPRNQGRPGLMPAVLEAFARPRAAARGRRSGRRPNRDPPGRLPHLWHHTLTTTLKTPLHERVLVHPGSFGEGSGAASAESLHDDVADDRGEDPPVGNVVPKGRPSSTSLLKAYWALMTWRVLSAAARRAGHRAASTPTAAEAARKRRMRSQGICMV